jgi:hypothetical protein
VPAIGVVHKASGPARCPEAVASEINGRKLRSRSKKISKACCRLMKLFFVKLFIALARNFKTGVSECRTEPASWRRFRIGYRPYHAVQKALLAAPQKGPLRRSIAVAACNIPSARHDLRVFVRKNRSIESHARRRLVIVYEVQQNAPGRMIVGSGSQRFVAARNLLRSCVLAGRNKHAIAALIQCLRRARLE